MALGGSSAIDLLTGGCVSCSLPAEAGEGVDEEVEGELVCGPEVNPVKRATAKEATAKQIVSSGSSPPPPPKRTQDIRHGAETRQGMTGDGADVACVTVGRGRPDSAPVSVELGLGHLVETGGEARLELRLVVVQVACLRGSVVEHLKERDWTSS